MPLADEPCGHYRLNLVTYHVMLMTFYGVILSMFVPEMEECLVVILR